MSKAMRCNTCRLPLNRLEKELGTFTTVQYRHPESVTADHKPDPIAAELCKNPVGICDFCSAPSKDFVVFVTDQNFTMTVQGNRAKIVDESSIHTRQWRKRSRQISDRELGRKSFGAEQADRPKLVDADSDEFWSACPECEPFVRARDLWGLVSRVYDCSPEMQRAARKEGIAVMRGRLSTQLEGTLALIVGEPITVEECRERIRAKGSQLRMTATVRQPR